jgi:hypothetical protein
LAQVVSNEETRVAQRRVLAIIALPRRPCTLPTRAAFELVVNLKTAKALGLTILKLLLTCIDEVIE